MRTMDMIGQCGETVLVAESVEEVARAIGVKL